MPHRTISVTTYVLVCVLLVVLTVLTVGVSFAPIKGVWHVVLGLIIAVCKASLVVLFFMHALLSDRVTWAVIAVMCFWLGIMLVLTLGDYFSRNMIPFMEGH
jgi:cytochrome c oxidase subunit 4